MKSIPSFGAWIKERRQALDLTQESLAAQAGCAEDTIRKIESGRRRPSRQIAELLAERLGVPSAERPAFVQWARGAVEPAVAELELAPSPPPPPPAPPPRPPAPANRPATPGLPSPITTLVGRAAEIAQTHALLHRANVRLITLTGPPGIGKTRLALAVATSAQADFTDGVVFIPLAALTDPTLLLPTLAHALDLPGTTTRPEAALHDYLRSRHMLLVLDNFEQLLPAAPLVANLLVEAPGLKALVTSRAPLRLRGEKQVPLSQLALPDLAHLPPPDVLRDVPAIALFVERAQEVQPAFDLSAENAPAVAAICARLDGLPLALELAAARSRFLPPPALLARLEHRLDLLAGGWRDLPARQQSLQGAIEWSYDLLGPVDQALFRHLAVFAGGATLPALEASFADLEANPTDSLAAGNAHATSNKQQATLNLLDSVANLVDQSLLRESTGADGESRYTMLETIREFAGERLEAGGEAAATRAAHARFCLALAEQAQQELRGPANAVWIARLDAEHDNIRAALAWSQTPAGDADLGARLARALWLFWYRRGYLAEGLRWLEAAIARRPGATDAIQADALNGAGVLALYGGEATRAIAFFEQSRDLRRALGDTRGVAASVNNLGLAVQQQGDYARADALFAESEALERELGNRPGVATSLSNRGGPAYYLGEYKRARALHEESLSLSLALGDAPMAANAVCNLALVAWAEGHYDQASAYLADGLTRAEAIGDDGLAAWGRAFQGQVAREQGDYAGATELLAGALAYFRQVGNRQGMASTLYNLGQVAILQGDWRAALAHFAASLRERQRILGVGAGIADALEGIAASAGHLGQVTPAARVAGAAAALRARTGALAPPVFRTLHEQQVQTLRERLGPDAWDSAWAAGQDLPLDTALEEATHLAAVAGAGELETAH